MSTRTNAVLKPHHGHDVSFSRAGVPPRHTPHTMNHELLRAAATGDKALLEQVLGLRSTTDNGGELEATHRGSRSCLKGVTSEGNTALHIAAGRGYLEPGPCPWESPNFQGLKISSTVEAPCIQASPES